MKKILTTALCAASLLAVSANAAGKYPFPQNKANPNGYTVPFADTDVIQKHFEKWKKGFYDSSRGWVYSPEGKGSTVSEGIAYGMLIMVYMDNNTNNTKNDFDKLYATWKGNMVSGCSSVCGMNWRVGDGEQGGSASDADFDAALALVMAYYQWGDQQYLNDAKSLISWLATGDIKNGKEIKPGNQWDDAFNPSYTTLANFEVFKSVDGSGPWANVISTSASELLKCQNSSSGLVTDWCSWGGFQPVINSAAAVGDGKTMAAFFDDAARTPWRTAWSYYWFANNDAKTFNQKVVNWLYSATFGDAGAIMSGYKADGSDPNIADRKYVSSTFSGGLGLAASTFTGEADKAYMKTVYKTLARLEACEEASTCGNDGVVGEKYYPATLNILYMLLMSGNMPNFAEIDKFKSFTPDKSLLATDFGIAGTQMALDDSTVGLSGFWKWGAYHDKLPALPNSNVTKMAPDSGSSPLFLNNGVITAEAVIEIAPEPEYGSAEATAGKYPSAGIAMSFNQKETGVDLLSLGVTAIRFNIKTTGTIRFALLNTSTSEAGGEPGYVIEPTGDYKTITLKLAGGGTSTVGDLEVPTWVNDPSTANDVMKTAKGVKFEAKMTKGGDASISLKSIEFLKGNEVVDPFALTGTKIEEIKVTSSASVNPTSSASVVPGSSNAIIPGSSASVGLLAADALSMVKVAVHGTVLSILDAKVGSSYAVLSVQGKVIAQGKVTSANQMIAVPNKGMYLVKVGSDIRPVNVK